MRSAALFWGLVLVVLGLLLFLGNLGVPWAQPGSLLGWGLTALGAFLLLSSLLNARRRYRLFPGIWFIGTGICLLLANYGLLGNFGFDVLCPGFLITFGLAFYPMAFVDRDPSPVFPGTGAVLIGALVLAWNMGYIPYQWDVLWPSFFVILGLCFFALFLARPSSWGVLIPAAVNLGIGLASFLVTLNRVSEKAGLYLLSLWPILIVLAGLALILDAIFGGKGREVIR
ncbi:MAG: hypothetical protein HY871_05225 [Chloroflexi bacterium]|nr:hypothetical protein [Chloroflexota bacterium]